MTTKTRPNLYPETIEQNVGEDYTPKRMAQFILSSATDNDDYTAACLEVRRLGLDPAKINHVRPKGQRL